MDIKDLIIPDFSVDLFPTLKVYSNALGQWESVYRGDGYGLAGIRHHQSGDGIRRIAWKATAKRGELMVRETYSERSLSVLIVVDGSPRMGAYDLEKLLFIKTATGAIINGAQSRNLALGFLDWAKGKEHYRRPQEGHAHAFKVRKSTTNRNFLAVDDNVNLQLTRLKDFKKHLPKGTMLFLFSDFFVLPAEELIIEIAKSFDFHPVIVQHPIWEKDFPEIEGTLSFAEPLTNEIAEAFFTLNQSRSLAKKHRQRYADIVSFFESMEINPITLTTSDEAECERSFAFWSNERSLHRVR